MTIHTTPRVADHDIADLFLRRWSPRAFSGERISDEALSSLFEAARWAPSSSNSQPWRFIYAHRGTAQFNRIISTINPRNQRWAKDASVLVALLSKRAQQGPGQDAPAPLRNHSLDAGAAWAHLALQATHSGWIAHAIGGFEAADARRELAIPENYNIEILIAVGRHTDPGRLPDDLKAREVPSSRNRIATFVSEGGFDSNW